ncbi:hypothetical protein PG993_005095 [Apiospora rasikravindrae]|uniref:Uncharacterized protein n=1 Tax=Apiospora rasikravindrae TaxID=990691 RepID=A0ABR1TEL1_9PEZI
MEHENVHSTPPLHHAVLPPMAPVGELRQSACLGRSQAQNGGNTGRLQRRIATLAKKRKTVILLARCEKPRWLTA